MNIVILKNNLKEGLGVVSGSCKDGARLPILKNILIDSSDGKVKMSATDLEIGVIQTISAKILEGGSVVVPYAIFSQIINNIESERINLETINTALVVSTENFKAKIATVDVGEFPIIPSLGQKEVTTFTTSTAVLTESIVSVIAACQVSDLRPELSGILFLYKNNSTKCVATDSFRLAEKTISPKKIESSSEDITRIIPLKTVQEVVRIFGSQKDTPLELVFDENQVLCKNESTYLISRLIEGTFPEYEQIIPKNFETEIVLEKENIISAVKLSSSLSNKLHEVRIITDDTLKNIKIISSSVEFGESEYVLPAKIKGEKVQVTFNWRFLLDGLKNTQGKSILIGCNGEERPSAVQSIEETGYRYVIMPIKSSS